MLEEKVNIAIDGLSVTGKDTITKILYYVLNNLPVENAPSWQVIDSSAMYRTLGLFLDEHCDELGIKKLSEFERFEKKIQDKTGSRIAARLVRILSGYEWKIKKITGNLLIESDFNKGVSVISGLEKLGLGYDSVEYSDNNLRTTHVDTLAGYIAKFTSVRPLIVDMERKIAMDGYCLVLGRDGYSVVLQHEGMPKSFGLYPWANFDARVERRMHDRDSPREVIEKEIRTRDERDTDPNSNNVPGDIEKAVKRGYHAFDNSGMDIYQMGEEASKIALSMIKAQIPEESIRKLVKEAVVKYKLTD